MKIGAISFFVIDKYRDDRGEEGGYHNNNTYVLQGLHLNLTCINLNLTCLNFNLTCINFNLTCLNFNLTCLNFNLTRIIYANIYNLNL